jgi:hypothetical protein
MLDGHDVSLEPLDHPTGSPVSLSVHLVGGITAGVRFPAEVIVLAVRWYLRFNLVPAETGGCVRRDQAVCWL